MCTQVSLVYFEHTKASLSSENLQIKPKRVCVMKHIRTKIRYVIILTASGALILFIFISISVPIVLKIEKIMLV